VRREALAGVNPNQRPESEGEAHREQQQAAVPETRYGTGPRGEHGDEHQVAEDHRRDAGQQYGPASEPVDEKQRDQHRAQRSQLHERGQHEQCEVALKPHGLEKQRTVVDDPVDPGQLSEEAEPDDECGGAQIRRAQHLDERAALLFPHGVGDLGELLLDVPVRLHPQQRPAGVVNPVLEQVPPGGVGHSVQERKNQQRGDRGQPQHPAPAARIGQHESNEIAGDDAQHGRHLVGDQQ
jgi:hypothetical protein